MNNFKLLQTSNLDEYQMNNRTFDANKDAWRVSVIDGVTLNVDQITLPEFKLPEQKTIEVPVIIKESEIHQINVPVVVKEVQIVEVPVMVKEVEYKTIEIPVIVPEVRIIEVEKPIMIKEIQFKELSTFIKACIILQAISMVGLLITNILKG